MVQSVCAHKLCAWHINGPAHVRVRVLLILLHTGKVDVYIYGRGKCYPRDYAYTIGKVPKVVYILSLDYRNGQVGVSA